MNDLDFFCLWLSALMSQNKQNKSFYSHVMMTSLMTTSNAKKLSEFFHKLFNVIFLQRKDKKTLILKHIKCSSLKLLTVWQACRT